METTHQMEAEKMGNLEKAPEACLNHLKPFKKLHICFPTSEFSLFYTFIEEKRNEIFLLSTAIIIFTHRLDAIFLLLLW